jgi:cyanophycinase
LLVDTPALAAEPYVRWTLDHAEAIFIAGGDQFVYLTAWKNTSVEDALRAAWQRGAVIGGTSAGCAVLGSIVYSAAEGSVYSDEALEDPFNPYMTFERDFLDLSPLAGVVTDTHFATRDRMGRLLGFVARALTDDGAVAHPLGIGVDERTALLVDEAGRGTVVGAGAVYVVSPAAPPTRCTPGTTLRWDDVPVHKLRAGDTIALPTGTTSVTPATISARDGQLVPQNPY